MNLVQTTIASPSLTGVTNDDLAALVNLKPDFSTGDQVHGHYVNHVAGALPGEYSQLFGRGPSFRSVFYPNYASQPLEEFIESDTGLDGNFWSPFSVAVLCQIIARTTSNIRGQMVNSRIDGDIASFNAQLNGRSARFYSRVLATFAPIASIVSRLNLATAKADYRQALIDNILVRQIWYQSGLWNSPDWEIFNHYAKYMVLGATETEVDALIDALVAGGLPMPGSVDKAHWRAYANYLASHPTVDYTALSAAASDAVHATTYPPSFGPGPSMGLPEGNCYEFTANSQPGNTYREPPSHSCLSANTEVLMASGTPKLITAVVPGDQVLSPSGARTVLYVSTPSRGGRPLFRLRGGIGPAITATHPLVSAETGQAAPAALSVDAARLLALLPVLSERGVGKLGPGRLVHLRDRRTGEDRVGVHQVEGIDQVASDDEMLYDLILAYGQEGSQQYWAGRDGTFVLTQPEMAPAREAPHAALTVAALLEGLRSRGVPGIDHRSDRATVERLRAWLHHHGAAVFQGALLTALERMDGKAPLRAPATADLGQRIDGVLAALAKASPVEAVAIGTVVERLLDDVGVVLDSTIQTGFRSMAAAGGDVLALTVFDIVFDADRGGAIPLGTHLVVSTEGGTAPTTSLALAERPNCTPFRRSYQRITHFEVARGSRGPVLHFDLQSPGTALAIATGRAAPLTANVDYQRRTVTLFDAQGATLGWAHLDLRRMSLEAMHDELARSAEWSAERAASFAEALGVAMLEPILATLARRPS